MCLSPTEDRVGELEISLLLTQMPYGGGISVKFSFERPVVEGGIEPATHELVT